MAKRRLSRAPCWTVSCFEDLIHKGGMARLWRVTRAGMPMPLVMKVPPSCDGEDPAAIVGFEIEQMILPRLTGPHVPRFVAARRFARQPYIVMERIAGAIAAEAARRSCHCLPRR